MYNKFILLLLLCFTITNINNAQSHESVEKSTDILMFATPVAGFVTTLALGDYKGSKQLILGGATSVATSYLLKYSIQKERPDRSDNHSFPSNHTAMAFQGASFIHIRYGWKYAIPAYLVSTYVAWGRIYAKRHDGWDVFGGAVIGIGSSLLYTRPFVKKNKVQISPVAIDKDHWGIYASVMF